MDELDANHVNEGSMIPLRQLDTFILLLEHHL
jgi:hypothetical protein